jgi:hypothetical protein
VKRVLVPRQVMRMNLAGSDRVFFVSRVDGIFEGCTLKTENTIVKEQ